MKKIVILFQFAAVLAMIAKIGVSCTTDEPKCAKIVKLEEKEIKGQPHYYFRLSDGYVEEVRRDTWDSYPVGDERCR